MSIFEFQLFGLTIAPTYYGLAYAVGMLAAYAIVERRWVFTGKDLEHLFYAVFFGILLGWRLGYVLIYQLPYYLENPLKILALTEGGMSFHGGIIGVIIGLFIFATVKKVPVLRVWDEVAATVPIGIFLGRIANYVNNELVGFTPYSGPFAMIRDGVSHFPAPLLEAVLEGLVLFVILRIVQKKYAGQDWVVAASFLVGYGALRFLAEFTRLPDPQIGYIFDVVTLGQILSFVTMDIWITLLVLSKIRKP